MSGEDLGVHPAYRYSPEYLQMPCTCACFVIIGREIQNRPAVLLKQRPAGVSFAGCYDLPGGAVQAENAAEMVRAAEQLVQQQLGAQCEIRARVGSPLWLVFRDGEESARADFAQAYLAKLHGEPKKTDHVADLCWVDQDSVLDCRMVDPEVVETTAERRLSRMEAMIYDGLSVLQQALYDGPLTGRIVPLLPESRPDDGGFFPIDGGRRLARFRYEPVREHLRVAAIQVYSRLNPFETEGCYMGSPIS